MTDIAKKFHKRWGNKFKDNRNWPKYNGQLVKRGEYFLDLCRVRSWNEELVEMNNGKIGHPYEFPNSLIRTQAIWHTLASHGRHILGNQKDVRRATPR